METIGSNGFVHAITIYQTFEVAVWQVQTVIIAATV